MKIDLTLPEACYLRDVIETRVDSLNHSLGKYRQYSNSHEDVVTFQKRICCIMGEISELEHVRGELTLVIAQSVVCGNLLDEFGITTH